MEEFILSNSKLQDWETMCPIEFKAKHIDKNYPPFEPTLEMELGNYFETLVIGGGINGAFDIEKSVHGSKIKNGVYFERVKQQAEACKAFLKAIGGKIISRQEYIKVKITNEADGQQIWIEGTLDIRYMMPNGKMAVIDLKFTGDTETDFGKFAWGTPEKMDLSQIKQYKLLTDIKYDVDAEAYYWVFDKGTDLKKKLIWCKISEYTIEDHKQRLFQATNDIEFSIAMNDWQPKNTWENCSKCKAPCNFKRIMPEYYIVEM